MDIRINFTSEELKGIMKQPQDSCPFLNEVIHYISIQKDKRNLSSNCLESLNNASKVIHSIKDWGQEWKKEYLAKEPLGVDDDFVEAYIDSAKHYQRQNKRFDLNFEIQHLHTLIENYEEGFLEEQKSLPEFNQAEHDNYMKYKSVQILENVERIRNYAKNERSIGQSYKDAYKNISINHEIGDLDQPYEIIHNEQGHRNNIFNLGVLNHQKTFKTLKAKGIIDDFEMVSLSMLSRNKMKEFVFSKIKEYEPTVESIVCFDTIDDFKNKNGYETHSFMNKEGQKRRNRIKHK